MKRVLTLVCCLAFPTATDGQTVESKDVTAILAGFPSADHREREKSFNSLLALAGPAPGPDWLQQLFKRAPTSEEPIRLGLIRLLEKENARVKTAKSLGEDYLDYWLSVIVAVASLKDMRALPALIDDMGHGQITMNAVVAYGPVVIDSLLARSGDSDMSMRGSVMLALSQMLESHRGALDSTARTRIKNALTKGTADSSWSVRISAVMGLASVPDADVTELLRRIAASDPFSHPAARGQAPSFPVRNAALRALAGRSPSLSPASVQN